MIDARTYACAICGEANPDPTQWFLVTENHWEDKLKILEWNSLLAHQQGIHLACSPSHVQELVVHWMATGSVSYPFAQAGSGSPARRWTDLNKPRAVVNTTGVRTVGELTVHRESMRRVLGESPESLKSILSALQEALQPANATARDQFEMLLGELAQET
ncbi:MAG TPA: hypothetical protein VIW67_11440 [Terriglobales bacterium]